MDLNPHGTDDQLELYARGKLPHPEVVVLEEHLLACPACVERLEESENWTVAVRTALAEPEAESAGGWLSWPLFAWSGSGWVRQTAMAGALAAVLLVAGVGVYLSQGHGKPAPVATLELAAMRGDMVTAARARETDLTLTDAPAGQSLKVTVVSATGSPEWEGMAPAGDRGVSVKIARELRPGLHFVRLYGTDGTMLHEYGLRVRE